MNSKVIKWFKRQASIRRHSSEKPEEKNPSHGTSEEKRKHNFPRLSFRKRNKRKGEKGTEFDGTLSVIGISKKFSLSVPKEMEANTKDSVVTVPNSHSDHLGCISLTNSPNKTDYYSVVSEPSGHSSFDYSKENTNESMSLSEAEAAKPIVTDQDVSEISKSSNCDNQQSFQPVNGSVHKNNTNYLGFSHKTDSRYENAPIVKMDDICDIFSDKEYPEEMQSSSTSDSLKVIQNNATVTSESDPSSYTSDKIYEDLCDRSLEEHLTKEKDEEEIDLFIKEERDSSDNRAEESRNSSEKKVDAFEEIDRLVRDATSITADEISEMDAQQDEIKETNVCLNLNESDIKDDEKKDFEGLEEKKVINNSSRENISVLCADDTSNSCVLLSQSETLSAEVNEKDQPAVDEFEENSIDSNVNNPPPNIAQDTLQETLVSETNKPSQNTNQDTPQKTLALEKPGNSYNENQIKDLDENNATTEPPKTEEEIELVIKEESDLNDNDTIETSPKSNISDSSDLSHISKNDSLPPVQIVLTQSSPVKHSKVFAESPPKSSKNYYPKELNPFGDDDYDSVQEITKSRNFNGNKQVSPSPRNRTLITENVSQFGRETSNNFNGRTKHIRKSSSSPVRRIETVCTKGGFSKSLNPFGDSDDNEDEGVSSLNSTNPFDDEDATICGSDSPSNRRLQETPPRLPPKSLDLQTRKNSRGSLAPIPIPRRSKQSHHGSYMSLQNVSTIPIPAPRSITPFGSTKTLNYSTNPFDDDENETSLAEFDRRDIGRSSMQALPTSVSHEPLSRTNVRGSLPPSAKLKLGRKKRPAPLPPGFSQRKQQLYPNLSDFSSLPRKRSSTFPASDEGNFDKRAPTSREINSHRMPPPRPPPPKIHF